MVILAGLVGSAPASSIFDHSTIVLQEETLSDELVNRILEAAEPYFYDLSNYTLADLHALYGEGNLGITELGDNKYRVTTAEGHTIVLLQDI